MSLNQSSDDSLTADRSFLRLLAALVAAFFSNSDISGGSTRLPPASIANFGATVTQALLANAVRCWSIWPQSIKRTRTATLWVLGCGVEVPTPVPGPIAWGRVGALPRTPIPRSQRAGNARTPRPLHTRSLCRQGRIKHPPGLGVFPPRPAPTPGPSGVNAGSPPPQLQDPSGWVRDAAPARTRRSWGRGGGHRIATPRSRGARCGGASTTTPTAHPRHPTQPRV